MSCFKQTRLFSLPLSLSLLVSLLHVLSSFQTSFFGRPLSSLSATLAHLLPFSLSPKPAVACESLSDKQPTDKPTIECSSLGPTPIGSPLSNREEDEEVGHGEADSRKQEDASFSPTEQDRDSDGSFVWMDMHSSQGWGK